MDTLILLELFFYGLGTAVFLQPDKVVHLIDRTIGQHTKLFLRIFLGAHGRVDNISNGT